MSVISLIDAEKMLNESKLDFWNFATNKNPEYEKLPYKLSCKQCGRDFLAPHNTFKFCERCLLRATSFICLICHQNFVDFEKSRVFRNKVCETCFESLPGSGRFVTICDSGHIYKVGKINNKFLMRCVVCLQKELDKKAKVSLTKAPPIIVNYDDLKCGTFQVCSCCGRDFLYSISGMRFYCSQSCYEEPYILSLCEYCGSEILVSGKELRAMRGKKRINCGRKSCLEKATIERYSKIDYVKMMNAKKQKSCELCGNDFVGKVTQKLCDSCKWKRTHATCTKCGNVFECRNSYKDGFISVCDNCIIGKGRYTDMCSDEQYESCNFKLNCSRYYHYTSPQSHYCKTGICCSHGFRNTVFCQECSPRSKVQEYNKLKNSLRYSKRFDIYLADIPEFNQLDGWYEGRKEYRHICSFCNRPFSSFGPISNWCKSCWHVIECQGCGCKFVSKNKNVLVCGQACSGIYFHKFGFYKNIELVKKNLSRISRFDLDTQDKLNISNFTKITKENLDDFNVYGVWFKVDRDTGEVLDVCLTKNIYKEYKYHFSAIENKINYKYSELSKYKIDCYFLTNDFNTWEEGLDIEMNFALKTNAKYWNPAPGPQISKISKLKQRSQ